MMKYLTLVALSLFTILSACKITKNKSSELPVVEIALDTLEVSSKEKTPVFQKSTQRVVDLLHTEMDISFDWKKQYVLGNAKIWLTPYFYDLDSIVLDAKGMEVKAVNQINLANDSSFTAPFHYQENKLTISLSQTAKKGDSLLIQIDYVAKPNESEVDETGSAIRSDKGLYFINPLGEDPKKPKQIWTQGEPESNSHWFPTIDAPNEKMTHEIAITVSENYKTLSNGRLDYSTLNGDGTRTDYWVQTKPHAPYLVMMAIGEFAVVKDEWNDLNVHYYVEPKFEKDAKAIFRYTPDMLNFFSEVLGVQYPWDKFHQVIVRDYVSGAMENTSAVIFGEFVQKTTRELIDDDNQNIVAHEMFHHWFGDLVTCESWAHLPLNESFATYGPYLWREHKYGKDDADHYLEGNLNSYFEEALFKKENMVRYTYEEPLEMFDSHSYSKGSVLLHMLRNYIGDTAFFAGIKQYLQDHAYQSAEVVQLRLSMEKATGLDLSQFFEQWFYDNGHPKIEVDYFYLPESKELKIRFVQEQEQPEFPIYTIPIDVDVWVNGTKTRFHDVLKNKEQTFVFSVKEKPQNVLVDPNGVLLVDWLDNKSYRWYVHQYNHAKGYRARLNAFSTVSASAAADTNSKDLVIAALNDPHYAIRSKALNEVQAVFPYKKDLLYQKLVKLTNKDENPKVRALALEQLVELFKEKDLFPVLQTKLSDSSYSVLGKALKGVTILNPQMGLMLAEEFENENSPAMILNLAEVYASSSQNEKNEFFKSKYSLLTGRQKGAFFDRWADLLININNQTTTLQTLPIIENEVLKEDSWWVRYYMINGLQKLKLFYLQKAEIEKTNSDNSTAQMLANEVSKSMERILEVETNKRILTSF